MSPPFTGLGPYSYINAVSAPDAWHKSRLTSVPLGQLAGEIDLHQYNCNNHFLAENPQKSELYELPSWTQVKADPRTVTAIVHMCAAGLKEPSTNQYVLQPTEFVASDERLLAPIRHFRCNQRHAHATLQGSWRGERRTHRARIWTWTFASQIASGIAEVCRDRHRELYNTRLDEEYLQMSPTTSTSTSTSNTSAIQPKRSDRKSWGCKACQNNIRADDIRHTRDPEGERRCRYPLVAGIDWQCPACKAGLPRSDAGHTLDPDCKFKNTPLRTSAPRTGRHPREPRRPATGDPTSALQPIIEADEEPTDAPQDAAASSSSSQQKQSIQQQQQQQQSPTLSQVTPRDPAYPHYAPTYRKMAQHHHHQLRQLNQDL